MQSLPNDNPDRNSQPSLSNRLADLAEQIASIHREYLEHREEAAARFVTFGRMLNEAKAECRHGEFLPFLERTGIPKRTAQRSMRIAAAGVKYAQLAHLGTHETDLRISIAKRRCLPVTDETIRDLPDILRAKLAKADARHEEHQAQIRKSEAESARLDRMKAAIRDALVAAPRSNALALEVVDEVLAKFYGVARKA